MTIDPYILTFSALTVIVTVWMGFWAARKSKTAHDFYVAGRSVSVGWNASAISGEYLSAASFMGVAGMVMSSGYDALWYPLCYACGYLFLLLFIAGPLRRFGAYTIPDFAEGRYDSPVFRKIAVVFVLFIGFFYTMPQMKGAGTTLAYIFPGLPYWAGVVLVGAVITLNVALGGMKGITLVQALQYWAKMFAISVPIFVLMSVYGWYGKQLGAEGSPPEGRMETKAVPTTTVSFDSILTLTETNLSFQKLLKEAKTIAGVEKFAVASTNPTSATLHTWLVQYAVVAKRPDRTFTIYCAKPEPPELWKAFLISQPEPMARPQLRRFLEQHFETNGFRIVRVGQDVIKVFPTSKAAEFAGVQTPEEERLAKDGSSIDRAPLPAKAPSDSTWLNPFGPLTTKAAKAAAAALTNRAEIVRSLPLRADLSPNQKMTVSLNATNLLRQAFLTYEELTGRKKLPQFSTLREWIADFFAGRRWMGRPKVRSAYISYHADGLLSAVAVKEGLEAFFRTNGIAIVADGDKHFRAVSASASGSGDAASLAALYKAWLETHERPLALLYTYSLIIALVCGTAGLPHILVRFYTNPDGVAAKRTTMWVMILIGVFYLFPPIFGVLGRNLLPSLYAAVGAKGTDKVVLELPRLLNEQYAPLGSILSGITCAGAFAAFMSTFSGLLVSMTGALAHDVYGRMLRPQSTPNERMKAFKICAVAVGGVAILLGTQVEQFQINFMVGQAFAIAAASYFPLLFMSAWWRGMTMPGAATGMLAGGLLALAGITLTSFSDLKWLPLDPFWATHPLFRILCEQPAIWAVPLAILLMVVVSKLTKSQVPSDISIKMLVLHAPEKLGLKQEYIAEPHVK